MTDPTVAHPVESPEARSVAEVPTEALDFDAVLELATPLLREAFDDMPPEQAAVLALGRRIRNEVKRIHAVGVAAGRAQAAADIRAALAEDEADSDVSSGEAIWEQGGYRQGLRTAAEIAAAVAEEGDDPTCDDANHFARSSAR